MKDKEEKGILTNSEKSCQEFFQRKWYSIDSSMIVSKLGFLCVAATFASTEPYLLLILISVGLDPVDAGLVGGLRFIGGFVGGKIWGLIADYKKCHRLVLFMVCLGALLSMGAQPFLILWLGTNAGNTCSKANTNHSFGNSTLEQGTTNETINEKSLFYSMLMVNFMVKFFDTAYRGFLDSGVV